MLAHVLPAVGNNDSSTGIQSRLKPPGMRTESIGEVSAEGLVDTKVYAARATGSIILASN